MIAVVDYHKGNLKSVERGLVGVGADARITDDVAEIAQADAVVLPGVGAFADAAASMEALGQMTLLRDRIDAGVPFLGICLGLHLMFDAGEEHMQDEPTAGLGLVPGVVRALPACDSHGHAYKIPHVGWNSIDFVDGRENPLFGWNNVDYLSKRRSPLCKDIKDREFFYFTHSFAAPPAAEAIATTTHSTTFPSVVQVSDVCFGVQFHPEKSSDAGLALLRNFVDIANARASR